VNIIDSFYKAVNPRKALAREMDRFKLKTMQKFTNSGYDQSGASHTKKSMRGWRANSRTAREDIDPNLHTLRQRSRDLYMSSPLAVSALKTKKTNTIGSGLRLKSRIDYKFLGISQEQAAVMEANIEREFELFAKSKHIDALKLNNFYELQPLAFGSWKLNGDCFSLIKYEKPTTWMPYGLRIYLIEGDRVTTPNTSATEGASLHGTSNYTIGKNTKNGNYIYSGVEVNAAGGVVAYWVCNQYLNSTLDGTERKWERVEAYGAKTGNPNVLHLFDAERCEQYRGVPFLAPVIEQLKQITRYTEAELMAAVVQSFFTAFIKTTLPTNVDPFTGEITGEPTPYAPPSSGDFELGPGTFNILQPGEDIIMADPKRPASGFEGFIATMAKTIGAALEIPYELLMKSFTASYSASRAALLEAWKTIKVDRAFFDNDFCQPLYELWLSEAVAIGRIRAPGFFIDPLIKAAWCKSEWIGPTQGQLDPVKEVEAAILRKDNGFSTCEQETTGLTGGNWDDNIEQAKIENQKFKDAGFINEAIPGIQGGFTDGASE